MTANGIRVEAHTALTPMRGRLYQQHRPGFVLRDDLENAITAESPAVTEKIIKLLDEAKGGMAGHGAALTLGNFIIEEGVIGYIKRSVAAQAASSASSRSPTRHSISWPDKYVRTDAEALVANKNINDPTKRKISLESKKRELNAGGRRVYEVEMMLDPVAAGSPFFDRAIIDGLMAGRRNLPKTRPAFAYGRPSIRRIVTGSVPTTEKEMVVTIPPPSSLTSRATQSARSDRTRTTYPGRPVCSRAKAPGGLLWDVPYRS